MGWPVGSSVRWRSALGALLAGSAAQAQNAASAARSLPIVPAGYESLAGLDRVTAGWKSDAVGNRWISRGSGAPVRVIACSIDRPGYVVSEITDDGYLHLNPVGNARRHPLWDQFHEGQRILIATGRGVLPGVVGVRSVHLWRRRPADEPITTVEGLTVDVGASSRADVERMGIRLLDPVSRDIADRTYGDGYQLNPGGWSTCAFTAMAAAAAPTTGTTIVAVTAQGGFDHGGLGALLTRVGKIDSLFVVDSWLAGSDTLPASSEHLIQRPLPSSFVWPDGVRIGTATVLAPASRFPGTLVESVPLASLTALEKELHQRSGNTSPLTPSTAHVSRPAIVLPTTRDSLTPVSDLLTRLTETYAVSGHEEPMRRAVRAALPAWARQRATVDTAGNLIVAAGPERDTVVFMAHLDEIGFEVEQIARDGTVSLSPRGGFYPSLWEGQPALLHLDAPAQTSAAGTATPAAPLSGVFVPRDRPQGKQPAALTVWFGLDSASLVARGVRPGLSVTGVKSATRLGRTRFTARSIDDRAGCTALILAMRTLDPARLPRRVIFVFSVREETGLDGAAALAAQHGRSVRRIHAVDTFVSSDSPLESHRFAYAPIGKGAVVRALDNSSVTPGQEVDRTVAIAKQARIPLQVGTTNGGNDGSEFVRYGAVDVPISWPLRYSHSPAEVIDLRDVQSLGRLVAALATSD